MIEAEKRLQHARQPFWEEAAGASSPVFHSMAEEADAVQPEALPACDQQKAFALGVRFRSVARK